MDRQHLSISPSDLYARLGTASAPVLVDVCRQDSFRADHKLTIGASNDRDRRQQTKQDWLAGELSSYLKQRHRRMP